MNRYPTQLSFDRSGSARVRFFGSRLANVRVHYEDAPKTRAPSQLLACPESIGIRKTACSWCAKKEARGSTVERQVAMGWDVDKGRWCVLVASPGLFVKLLDCVTRTGISLASFYLGNGPDVLIQRRASLLSLVVPLAETASIPRGRSPRPNLEDFMEGMERRSTWARNAD